MNENVNDKVSPWHIKVAAEAFAAGLFARCGFDVSIQYGPDQPEYDIIIAKADELLKVSVKGSQTGKWGICQNKITKGQADYHNAADKWLGKHKPKTVLCFVQFKGVKQNDLPRVYLATPQEVVSCLKATARRRGSCVLYEKREWGSKAYAAGTTDVIPSEWGFSKDRINQLFLAV